MISIFVRTRNNGKFTVYKAVRTPISHGLRQRPSDINSIMRQIGGVLFTYMRVIHVGDEDYIFNPKRPAEIIELDSLPYDPFEAAQRRFFFRTALHAASP